MAEVTTTITITCADAAEFRVLKDFLEDVYRNSDFAKVAEDPDLWEIKVQRAQTVEAWR